MKPKISLFIACTLDGYIATHDDSLQWLFDVEGEGDNGYSEFLESVDAIAMGKRTFDWLLQESPGDLPYPDRENYVFTKSPVESFTGIEFVQGDVKQFVESLTVKHLWVVGGGLLIKEFLENDLVDEIIVTIAPVLLGKGIRLFVDGEYEAKLRLVSQQRFNQFVELRYDVIKNTN